MLSLFIPCYNEEKGLKPNVERIYGILKNYQLQNKNFEFEIVIVNDCSMDNTEKVAAELAKNKDIRVINYHGKKPTRRENLLRSFKYAKGDIVGFTDADSSLDASAIPKAYTMINDRKTIVIGDRYRIESKVKRSLKRKLISKTLNYLTRILFFDWKHQKFKRGSRDHFCGLKLFPKEVIMHILEYTGIGNKERSMWWDAEMIIYAERLGYTIKPIGVKWKEEKETKLRIKRELGILKYMIKLWWRMHWTK